MDRYEFDIKIEQIKKLMKKKDFATAVKIADSIEWKKVKENPLLIIAADVYEVSGKYDEAREVLLLAYEKTGLGRQLAYRLCRLSVKRGDFNEAEEFYDEFTHNSPYDAGKYILQYEMAKGKGESLETQISILETFIGEDMDDRWAFELAKLYHKAHLAEKCVELCDTIILWFADGKYVEKALELKQLYVPLSENQRIKYEAQKSKKDRMVAEAVQNLVDGVSTEQPQETEKVEEVSEVSSEAAEVVEEVSSDEVEVSSESEPVVEQEDQAEEILDQVHEMDIDVNSIQVKDFSKSNQYDTINIQKELAKSVSTLFDNTVEIFKPVAPKTTVDEEQVDDQIEGQMSLEEVLAMFESGEIQTKSEDEQVIEETLIEETSIEETPIEETPIEEVSEEDVEEIFEEEIPETEEIDEMETLSQIIAEDIQEEIEEEILDEIEEVKEEENNLSMFNLKEDLEDEEPFEETLDEEIIEETEDDEEDLEDDTEDESEEELEEEPQEDDQEEEASAPAPVKQADIAKRELKRFISKFTGIKGLDKQILKVLQTALKTDVDPVKFIFVKGEVRSGKTTLAIEVIKVINRIIQRSGQKIAKIKAISLNDKSIEALIETLDGSDVLIERVSDMDIEVFIEFVEKLREEGKPRVVIFEDEKNLAEAFLEELPEEYADFTNVIDIKLNEIRDWATIAESYAKERGYTIDAMGTLALSAKIDQLKAVTKVIEKSHVEELIEEAIVNAEKFSVKKFFGKLFGKSKEGLKTLTEKNFI
ncbi:MAG: tetratricopeptide repeat protein [Lachnospiraceae bacterium]|nr:tetratricopeptide repeat protein [Lachnospiraceae bacterium]